MKSPWRSKLHRCTAMRAFSSSSTPPTCREGCRHHGVEHLVYASTSSVYGANTNMPFSEHGSAEHPLTLYAATKKANEQMAHSYAHLYGIPTTACACSRSMARGGARTWRCSCSPRRFWMASRSGCSTMASTSAASPTSTTSWKAWCVRWTACPAKIRRGTAQALIRPPAALRRIGFQHRQRTAGLIAALHRSTGTVPGQMELPPLQAGDVPDTEADVSYLIANVG